MDYLFNDFETFSTADLTKVGSSRYSRHPSTEALMLGYALNDGPIRQWVPAEGEAMPAELREMLFDPSIRKSAWNAAFEKYIWRNVLGVDTPDDQWSDSMAVAFSLSLPGSLADAGQVLGIAADKQKDRRGKALMRKFSMVRKPTKANPKTRIRWDDDPLDWLDYLTYNRQDVEAERAIWRKIRKWDLSEEERQVYLLDQEINSRGMPINLAFVRNAIAIRDQVKDAMVDRMRELTGLANPNSTAQLLPWLQERGYPFDDLKKGHVERAAERAVREAEQLGDNARAFHADYQEVLDLRSQVSKTSVTKYDALLRATDTDGFLRQTFQYAGAGRTWRWAGRIFQPQNLAKPDKSLEKTVEDIVRHVEKLNAAEIQLVYPKPIIVLSSAIRGAVQAPMVDGEEGIFCDVDLSAIENIVLGWMAGEQKILRVFEEGRDPYLDFAQYLFGMAYDDLLIEFEAGKKGKRSLSKPGVLGCGYMLSAGAIFENETTGELEATGLLGYAWNMGVREFTLEDSKLSVTTWRATYDRCVDYWKLIDNAAKRCMRTGNRTEAGPVSFRLDPPFLKMVLPSGRELSYVRPRLELKETPWGEMRETLTYEQKNDKNQWARVGTHPGKLTENADQAIARDLLAHGMLLAKARGLDIRLHVHDQLLTLGRKSRAARDLEILTDCMRARPKWGQDIPLNTGGFTSPIFTKD